MIEKAKNSSMQEKQAKNKEVEEIYFFPDYQISVLAKNREEAEKKLQEIIAKK
jgi:hypothetical protein